MRRPLMWFCIAGIAVIGLINYYYQRLHPLPELSGRAVISGRLYQKEVKDNTSVFYLKHVTIRFSETENHSGTIPEFPSSIGVICYLSDDSNDTSSYSDENLSSCRMYGTVRLEGDLSAISPATNPGEFDAAAYYAHRGYRYRLYHAKVKGAGGGNAVSEALYRLRRKAASVFYTYLGEEDGGVIASMLFGEKEYLQKETKDLYTLGGIAHILAISGLHITLIGTFFYRILAWTPLKRKGKTLFAAAILLLYGLMVGFGASVFRAVFMFVLRLICKDLKKPADPPTILSLSAFCYILFHPGMVTDSSFLLSYLAVASIGYIAPCLCSPWNRRKNFTDGLFTGFAVFLATLPLIVSSTHMVSSAGLVLNLIVLPMMPVLFVSAFLLFICSFLFPPLAGIFAVTVKSELYLFNRLCNGIGKLPFMNRCVKMPGTGRIIIYTTIIVSSCFFVHILHRKLKLRRYRLINAALFDGADTKDDVRLLSLFEKIYRGGLLVLFLLDTVFLCSSAKPATVTFLDVGQGDGVFIRTANQMVYMIDGGSTSKTEVGKRILTPYLLYEGECEVEGWFLTHRDLDHVSGFTEVLKDERIRIRRLYLPQVLKEDFEDIAREAARNGVQVYYLDAGDRIRQEGYSFTVLSPSVKECYEDGNAASFVLFYETSGHKYAFMGDSAEQGEEALLKALGENGHLDFLKCAHHGSANGSNSEALYTTLRPLISFVSCGRNNRYGHPHKEVLERIALVDSTLYSTAEDGAVTVTEKAGGRFLIDPFLGRRSLCTGR